MQIKDLAPNLRNPRRITDEKLTLLKNSFETLGPLHGFVFNRVTNRLVAGHQTKKVIPPDAEIIIIKKYDKPTEKGTVAIGYVEYGDEIIPYREVSVDEPTEMAMNVAPNKGGGEFDFSILPDVFSLIDNANIDLSLTCFTEKEIEDIMAPIVVPEEKKPVKCPACGHEF